MQEKIFQIIAKQFGIDQESVIPDMRLIDDLGADSMDRIELQMNIEEAFEFDIDDHVPATWLTVQCIINTVHSIKTGVFFNLQHHQIMGAEVKANVYAGDTCDQVENYFHVYCEGDKEASDDRDDIVIKVDELPPGTLISVKYPCCPECGQARCNEMEPSEGRWKITGHAAKCSCGFDWQEWVQCRYA
jgi:acyl carrier protein